MVEVILVYLSIGALIWLVIERLGIVRQTYDAAVARGEPRTKTGTVMATAMVIVGWPRFVWMWVKGMART